ncbi:hypothetical protein H9Q10_09955 [Eikenella sp. S3360]|uniref:Lipoprotein n=1 Tax=Eikenella glucosivorans TaxID=2766967 RepID=A0ABS0NCE5_9NEIS|nr:hypothetical protein [Eikenella glucosivorans]MBH5329984.1 hypothetical protein [Eikenella glucosivorans]
MTVSARISAKIKIALLLPLLALLCACGAETNHSGDGAASAGQSVAAPASVLQRVEVGKTTREQVKALYPDSVPADTGRMAFANRELTVESGTIDVYLGDIRGRISQRIMAFDKESGLLQSLVLLRVDRDTAPLLREAEEAGFAPYPNLTEQEFQILNDGTFPTAAERQKNMDRLGIRQFKRGSLLAFLIPAEANGGTAGLFVINLAYEPEHRAKWERLQAAQRQ